MAAGTETKTKTVVKKMTMSLHNETEKSYCMYQAFFDEKGNWTNGVGPYWFPKSVTKMEKKISTNNHIYFEVKAPEWLFKKYNLKAEDL